MGIYHLYNENKYTRWYDSIVYNAQCAMRSRKDGVYYENHHIHPNCFGGTKKRRNMVLLTAREHFLCHWLLTKMMADDVGTRKMMKAMKSFTRASKNQQRGIIMQSVRYRIAREIANKSFRGVPRSPEVRAKISAATKGRPHSAEHNRKMGLAHAGKTISEKQKREHSEAMKTRYANPEARLKTSIAMKAYYEKKRAAKAAL